MPRTNPFLFLLTVVAIILCNGGSGMSVSAQDGGQKATENPDGECAKVSLTANSDRLVKERPLLLRVKIRNTCDHKITFYEPVFELERITEDTRQRFRDGYGGRIIRDDNSEIDNTPKTLDGGKDIEFILLSNEIRWKMRESSVDVFDDIFAYDDLKMGGYRLYCTVDIGPNVRPKSKRSESNKKTITIAKE